MPQQTTCPDLETGDIHLYRLELDNPELCGKAQILCADEEARAARFRFPTHRNRFAAGRVALRLLLGRYVNVAPEAICLAYTETGKPYLANGSANLHFNVSNSDGLCLIALGRFQHLGVDVEKMAVDKELDQIAKRFFAPGEVRELMSLEPTKRARAFYACWTRKEAYVKALGVGLVYGLERFEVSLRPEAPVRVERIDGVTFTEQTPPRGTIDDPNAWSLFDLEIDDGYAAALAVHGTVGRVVRFNWDGA